MIARRTVVVVVVTLTMLGIFATFAISCRDATQVSLEARTNVAYRSNIVTSFTVGSSDVAVETAEPTTESVTPWGSDGFVGSLTVVPSESDDGTLAIKVIMGIARGPRECRAPLYEGCIVARRLVHYAPHRPLRLPIALWAQCEGVPCDAFSTCNALRQCVSAKVDAASCATSDGCTIAGDEGISVIDSGVDARPPSNDGGPPSSDASSSDAAGDSGDASVVSDGGHVGFIECGAGTKCAAGSEFCCAKSAGDRYCTNDVGGCQTFGGSIIRCDGSEDCPPDQQFCCFGSNSFACANTCGPYPRICHSTGICPPTTACTGVFKSYRYCE